MIAAVTKTDEISPARCREYALENFSCDRMVDDYINLYKDLGDP